MNRNILANEIREAVTSGATPLLWSYEQCVVSVKESEKLLETLSVYIAQFVT